MALHKLVDLEWNGKLLLGAIRFHVCYAGFYNNLGILTLQCNVWFSDCVPELCDDNVLL